MPPMAAPPESVPTPATPSRVLVADDDAASRHFLRAALEGIGLAVVTCADGAQALDAARSQRFDLLLLDCRMPGANAVDVLTAVRADLRARSVAAPAIASTAEPDMPTRRRLLAAGFSAVLGKPCGMGDVRAVLAQLGIGAAPLLDDDAALHVTGNAATTQALRGLLRAEVQSLQEDLASFDGHGGALEDRLHRLRSSCGFCGAPALAAATIRLQHQLQADAPLPPAALDAFRAALDATLHALPELAAPTQA